VLDLLSALFQSCYFAAISLTSVSLATLVTIGGTPVIGTVVEHARGAGAREQASATGIAGAIMPLAAVVRTVRTAD
jgi:drug/metabolite transporter, DME family